MKKNKLKSKRKYSYRGFFYRLLFLFIVFTLSIPGYYLYNLYKLEEKIVQEPSAINQTEKNEKSSTFLSAAKNIITANQKELKGESRERINVLLLGMGGEGHSGKYLTDTIMVASINPETYQTALLSIPRDLYVNIPETNIHTKINAVYAYEMRNSKDPSTAAENIKQVVQKITGQPIDYYFSLNFEGFKSIIDEIGGIDLDVPEDIYDPSYPGPNYSYQTFEIEKGYHHLDGETALKYARVRHTEGGDFARAARQQAIIAATKKKAFSIETLLNPIKISGIMDTLGENLKTNVQLDEIASFLNLSKNINIYQTTNKVLDAWSENSLLAVSHVELGGIRAFILIPRINNYKEIQSLAKNIFQIDYIEKQKEKIEKEDAEILVLMYKKDFSRRTQSLLEELGYNSMQFGTNDQFQEICTNETAIINNHAKENQEPKLFTINDLVNKLDAKTKDISKENIKQSIIICLNSENLEYFESQVYDTDNI
nr:LCP family protein [Patescibacteria group bacterium]